MRRLKRRVRRRLRHLRWSILRLCRPPKNKCYVNLQWGPGDLEGEAICLEFMPRVGDEIEIEIRNVADDPTRWRVTPHTVVGSVTRVEHVIHIDYRNDVGPNSFQSATVHVLPRPPSA